MGRLRPGPGPAPPGRHRPAPTSPPTSAGCIPTWDDAGVEATLANFEVLDDGTVRPWLTFDRHMRILRALWEHRPSKVLPDLLVPLHLLLVDGGDAWAVAKRAEAERAEAYGVRVRWFPGADHDVHVQLPDEVADDLHARRPGRASMTLPRILTIMGSGETSPTMSKVHRDLISRMGPPPVPAVMLDTPFGFQENADDITAKAVAYFRESVQREIGVASYRSAEGARRRRLRADAGPAAGGPVRVLRAGQPVVRPGPVEGQPGAGGAGREGAHRRLRHLRQRRGRHPRRLRPAGVRGVQGRPAARTGWRASTCWPRPACGRRWCPTSTTPRAATTTPGSATWASAGCRASRTSCRTTCSSSASTSTPP